MEKCQPKSNFYPIEVLSVCENQRVSKGQQTSSQVQTMIRVSVKFLFKFQHFFMSRQFGPRKITISFFIRTSFSVTLVLS